MARGSSKKQLKWLKKIVFWIVRLLSTRAGTGTMARKSSEEQLKRLKKIVFWIVLLEWVANAIGTLAFIWATVVLLGGFCSLLSRLDFWLATAMIFVEATRVFIRNDASVNRWLFCSTGAFRLENLPACHELNKKHALIFVWCWCTGLWFNAYTVNDLPETFAGVLNATLIVTLSQSMTRPSLEWLLSPSTMIIASFTLPMQIIVNGTKGVLASLVMCGLFIVNLWGMILLATMAKRKFKDFNIMLMTKPNGQLYFRATTALGLACWPFVVDTLPSYCIYFSTPVAAMLITATIALLLEYDAFSRPQGNSSYGLLLQIIESIHPILFFWSMMFPLPAISLKISLLVLFSVIAAVLSDNLQIPVALLQVLLSILRLCKMLGHHHHDYNPLPHDASPNLVPSIVVFFMLELCQGSFYILAAILGLSSLPYRRSLFRELGFPAEWGAKAIDLYYQARTKKGLFPSDKSTPCLAIEFLGCTSSYEMQIVGLRILDNSLEQGDSESNKKFITEIVEDARNIITNIVGLIRYCLTDKEYSEKYSVLCLEFVWKLLAINGGKISARFRKELSENLLFLDSLECILALEDHQMKLKMLVMDIRARLALDEAVRQEIGSTQSIIPILVHAYLNSDDPSLNSAAGEELANLAITSTDNCWLLLSADPQHNLISNLINLLEDEHHRHVAAKLLRKLIQNLVSMLEDEQYRYVAAKLLNNLSANSNLMNIGFGANVDLQSSALEKAEQIITTS